MRHHKELYCQALTSFLSELQPPSKGNFNQARPWKSLSKISTDLQRPASALCIKYDVPSTGIGKRDAMYGHKMPQSASLKVWPNPLLGRYACFVIVNSGMVAGSADAIAAAHTSIPYCHCQEQPQHRRFGDPERRRAPCWPLQGHGGGMTTSPPRLEQRTHRF